MWSLFSVGFIILYHCTNRLHHFVLALSVFVSKIFPTWIVFKYSLFFLRYSLLKMYRKRILLEISDGGCVTAHSNTSSSWRVKNFVSLFCYHQKIVIFWLKYQILQKCASKIDVKRAFYPLSSIRYHIISLIVIHLVSVHLQYSECLLAVIITLVSLRWKARFQLCWLKFFVTVLSRCTVFST